MFTIDAGKARTFLAEALRRHAQDNIGCHGDSAIPRLGVGWTLSPGWDYHDDGFYSDDLNHVEDLIYHAVQAGVISGPGDLDLMCYSGQDPCSDWMYQYRVSFHPGCAFALCDPCQHDPGRIPDLRRPDTCRGDGSELMTDSSDRCADCGDIAADTYGGDRVCSACGDDRELHAQLIWDIKVALGDVTDPLPGRIGPRYCGWLDTRIRTVHRALIGLLNTPGVDRSTLRMQFDRLQGLIEARMIVTGKSKDTGESRQAVIAHAWDGMLIDLTDLAAKIDRRPS
jgi:hypothetical protein